MLEGEVLVGLYLVSRYVKSFILWCTRESIIHRIGDSCPEGERSEG